APGRRRGFTPSRKTANLGAAECFFILFCPSEVGGRDPYRVGGMHNDTISQKGLATASSQESPPSPRARRRPYQAPRILERQPIEAVAAVCSVPGGKNDPTCLIGFS